MTDYPYSVRPLDSWPGPLTPRSARRASPFSARYQDTLELVDRELRHLGARNVLCLMAIAEDELRIDGKVRARTEPEHPGVVLAFDSRYGPLRYAVDRFTDWQSNLRALGLGLEALRKVDRYGVTKRGEQYTGWRQIEATTGGYAGSRQHALATLCEIVGREASAMDVPALIRSALRRSHPDAGGDPEVFLRVQEARRVIEEGS